MNDIYVEITGCEMDFVCPERWEDFAITQDTNIRNCTLCNKAVTFCVEQATLEILAKEGRCVAYEVKEGARTVRTVGLPRMSGKLRKFLDEI